MSMAKGKRATTVHASVHVSVRMHHLSCQHLVGCCYCCGLEQLSNCSSFSEPSLCISSSGPESGHWKLHI